MLIFSVHTNKEIIEQFLRANEMAQPSEFLLKREQRMCVSFCFNKGSKHSQIML